MSLSAVGVADDPVSGGFGTSHGRITTYTDHKVNGLHFESLKRKRHLRYSQRGVSGLLLITALAIIAIALFAISVPDQAALVSALQRVTNSRLAEINSALRRFAVTNGRLPCPAGITFLTTNPLFGVESGSPGGPGNCVPGGGVTKVSKTDFGGVPWVTLGLSADKAYDAYGHRIEYMVLEAATGSTINTIPSLTGELMLYSGTPVSSGAALTGTAQNQLNACSTTPSVNSCNQLGVFALLSRGPNAFGAYSDAGTQLPSLTGAQQAQYPAEWENLNGDLAFVAQTGLPQSTFDDTIVMQSTNDFIAGVYKELALSTETQITNNRLQKAFAAILGKTMSQRNTGFGTSACNGTPAPYACVIGITPDTNNDGTITAADTFAGTRQWLTMIWATQSATLPNGNIPYRDLGIPVTEVFDGWGHPLIYGVNSDMVAGSTGVPPRTSRGISSQGTAGRPRVMTTFGIVPYITAANSDMAFEVRSMGPDGLQGTSDDIYIQIRIGALVSNIQNAAQPLP